MKYRLKTCTVTESQAIKTHRLIKDALGVLSGECERGFMNTYFSGTDTVVLQIHFWVPRVFTYTACQLKVPNSEYYNTLKQEALQSLACAVLYHSFPPRRKVSGNWKHFAAI